MVICPPASAFRKTSCRALKSASCSSSGNDSDPLGAAADGNGANEEMITSNEGLSMPDGLTSTPVGSRVFVASWTPVASRVLMLTSGLTVEKGSSKNHAGEGRIAAVVERDCQYYELRCDKSMPHPTRSKMVLGEQQAVPPFIVCRLDVNLGHPFGTITHRLVFVLTTFSVLFFDFRKHEGEIKRLISLHVVQGTWVD